MAYRNINNLGTSTAAGFLVLGLGLPGTLIIEASKSSLTKTDFSQISQLDNNIYTNKSAPSFLSIEDTQRPSLDELDVNTIKQSEPIALKFVQKNKKTIPTFEDYNFIKGV